VLDWQQNELAHILPEVELYYQCDSGFFNDDGPEVQKTLPCPSFALWRVS